MRTRFVFVLPVLLAGWGPEVAAEGVGMLRETPPYFAHQFHFSYRGPNLPPDTDRPECRASSEAEAYFEAVRRGATGRGIPGETVIVRSGLEAKRFIAAAWSEKGVLPFEGNYAEVDYIVLRTRPDLAGYVKVHFGSNRNGIICNFAHPVVITAARMALGLSGVPPKQPWPEGDPIPGMSQDERDAFKMLYGLRNQMERGNAEERAEARRGWEQLLTTPGMRVDRPYPPDSVRPLPPMPRPEFEPTPKDVESDLTGRPFCRDRPYVRNCITGR